MADTVNMSLDDIIKQSRASRTRGRGMGRGRGRGRGGGGGNRSRSRLRSQGNTPSARQGRSRSRGARGGGQQIRGRSQFNNRSQSNNRSRSRQRFSNIPAKRASRSRSQGLSQTPELGFKNKPFAGRSAGQNRFFRQGQQRGLQRSNSQSSLRGNVHSRLGMNPTRGRNNLRRPLAVAKRGISKRGRGLVTSNRFSSIGLRSDQILKEQQEQYFTRNNIIRSQTFTRSRNPLRNPSQLTVSVLNDFTGRRRRNSVGASGYLNKQSLSLLNNQFGASNSRRGPGSVKSLGSNRSGRSSAPKQSIRSRGRGRGRGARQGVSSSFINKQILNPQLQKEIASLQGKNYLAASDTIAPGGINFTPTPIATTTTLHQRFAAT